MSAEIIPFRFERQDDGELRISDVEMGEFRPASTACADERPEGYAGEVVYFLWSAASGHIKIGYTSDIRSRLKAFACASAEAIHLLRLIPGGRFTEGRLHRAFHNRRVHGEWFTFHPAMLTVLRNEDCVQIEADIRLHLEREKSQKQDVDRASNPENAKMVARSVVMMGDIKEFGYDIEDIRLVLTGADDFATAEAAERMRRRRVETYLKRAFHELIDEMVTEDVDHVTELLCGAIKCYADIVRPFYAGLQKERREAATNWVNRILSGEMPGGAA